MNRHLKTIDSLLLGVYRRESSYLAALSAWRANKFGVTLHRLRLCSRSRRRANVRTDDRYVRKIVLIRIGMKRATWSSPGNGGNQQLKVRMTSERNEKNIRVFTEQMFDGKQEAKRNKNINRASIAFQFEGVFLSTG